MTIAAALNISVIDNDSIMALCREDGKCFVDSSLTIHTAFDVDTRRDSLTNVIGEIRKLKHGAEPDINLVGIDVVTQALQEGFADSLLEQEDPAIKQETEVEKRLKNILTQCLRKGASDIHILVKNQKTSIKVRIDGRMLPLMRDQNKEYGAELTAFIFGNYPGTEEPYSPLTPNAGSFTEKLALAEKGAMRSWDWRSSLLPVSSTKDDTECTKTTLRLLTPINDHVPTFEEMGVHHDHVEILTAALKEPQGGILISGPTGSGKTTLAMAALSMIPEHRSVNTLEDPPEWALKGISQTRIDYGKNAKGDTRDFAFYGKVLLRQDPDVIYFGELRDKKSAAEFTHLAESGHLLFGTTHTSSATGIVTKVVEHLQVPKSVAGSPDVFSVFTHQRLVRTLCPKCSIPHEKVSEEMKKLLTKGLGENLGKCRVKNPDGCAKCTGGEKGRTLVMEVIKIKDSDRDFIAAGDALQWRRELIAGGWKSIQHYAKEKVRGGVCDIESVAEQIRDLI